MPVLTSQERKTLEDACTKGQRASEQAVRAALTSLAVTAERPPSHLNEDDRQLRRGLRAKARQLGDKGDNLDLLVAECAYEQWHRLLFARFLAENSVLIHPEYRAPVTLDDCEELAESLAEPDGWSVAARFAAEILPGIFRLDDPCVLLRLAPEGRLLLESIIAGIPQEVFASDDALGWVYQYWQKDKKDEVNASERKIGGADLGPATQLFTEDYMVRFLLENSLGAWWASRHPDSPLIKEFEYLRVDEDVHPAAGSFDGWPEQVAAVTVMDPCCGSGHFLVEAFSMLWRMRTEEDGLSPVDAQDAVLRDNLFGLELDPRCVQIAMFAVALQAWKAGGGWRQLPLPNIACSGIPVKAPVEEWKALAGGDGRLENALVRLHILFRDADTLGSLIDPRRTTEIADPTGLQTSLEDVEWNELAPLILMDALARSEGSDPATVLLGTHAGGLARAAAFLSRRYTCITTNVPWVQRNRQGSTLAGFCDRFHPAAKSDLAFAFMQRVRKMVTPGGSYGLVTPQQWLTLTSYTTFRRELLGHQTLNAVATLGSNAFVTPMHPGIRTGLSVVSQQPPQQESASVFLDAQAATDSGAKAELARARAFETVNQRAQLDNPDSRILIGSLGDVALLSAVADSYAGIQTGDSPRFIRNFWELAAVGGGWSLLQTKVNKTSLYDGKDSVVFWENGTGQLYRFVCERLGESGVGAWLRGHKAWGKRGIAVGQMWELRVTLYTGELFDNNTAVIVPFREDLVPAVWAFCASDEFHSSVRELDQKLGVTNKTLAKVPFDVDRWRGVAEEAGPLPEPWSDDPTQWLFKGRPETSMAPLQVAVSRLLGYRWPEQPESDDLDAFADTDGIVCLPSVAGEAPAADRLQQVMAAAFGESWASAKQEELLEATGSKKKNMGDWLRDDFFKQHCAAFGQRPFVWHIWDGQREGFAALVNYHRLDRKTLEKLTYTYLGDWIERQRAEVRDETAGAEARLAAASNLRGSLELILDGEPPYDIYVRWKSLAEQPIGFGWVPDLNDGVRFNIRPFVEAGVLRSKVNVKWGKDRGKDPDGSERHNDLHFTTAQKRAARGGTA